MLSSSKVLLSCHKALWNTFLQWIISAFPVTYHAVVTLHQLNAFVALCCATENIRARFRDNTNTGRQRTYSTKLDNIMACTECKIEITTTINCHTLIKLRLWVQRWEQNNEKWLRREADPRMEEQKQAHRMQIHTYVIHGCLINLIKHKQKNSIHKNANIALCDVGLR